MKRFISTVLAVALLLGLGALAVLARPGGANGAVTRMWSLRRYSAPPGAGGGTRGNTGAGAEI